MVSNVLIDDADILRCGMRVVARFEQVANDMSVPRFVLDQASRA